MAAVGAGNDSIAGGAGDAHLQGDDGDDTLYGGAGDDRLEGGIGHDVLYGGEGDDRLISGGKAFDWDWSQTAWREEAYGEAGNDTVELNYGHLNDGTGWLYYEYYKAPIVLGTFDGGSGDDTLRIQANQWHGSNNQSDRGKGR